jgi:hypothetical protein
MAGTSALSAEVLARVQELEQERAERIARETLEAAARAELARRHPEDVGVGPEYDPASPAPVPEVKRPFLPAPEKWDGEVSVEDTKHATLGLTGKVWLASFHNYANEYQLNHLQVFGHYLKGKALLWFHQLIESAHARQLDPTWDEVGAEFIRQYSPADRRSAADIARATLINHECIMPAYSSFTQYEQTFRNLVRSCADMSEADKISWFIAGMSPYFRKQCATQQDGRPWTDLDDLSRYAQGVEVREFASRTERTTPSTQNTKRRTFAAAAAVSTSSQNLPSAKKARTEKSSDPKSRTRLVKDEKGNIIPGQEKIPFKLVPLWKVAVKNGWLAPNGKPYNPATFVAVACGDPTRCLQCHKTWGKDGECKGHAKSASGGSAGGSESRRGLP